MDLLLAEFLEGSACDTTRFERLCPPMAWPAPAGAHAAVLKVHHRLRDPVLDDRCQQCGLVVNAWTGWTATG